MGKKPSHLNRMLSKIREIPQGLARQTLLLFERLDYFLEGAKIHFQHSRLGQLWLKARWILLGLLWLVGLLLGYSGISQVSSEHALGWSAGDLLYRTLQLIFRDTGSLLPGLVSDQVVLMLEIARFLLLGALVYTGILVLTSLFGE